MCSCLSCTPYQGPGRKPRHVTWLGIEPATLWFTGWHLIHWATPARAKIFYNTSVVCIIFWLNRLIKLLNPMIAKQCLSYLHLGLRSPAQCLIHSWHLLKKWILIFIIQSGHISIMNRNFSVWNVSICKRDNWGLRRTEVLRILPWERKVLK